MMRRKYWVIAAAIPLILVAGDIAYWRIASERLRAGFQDWQAERKAQGWETASGPVSIGGWPQAATVTVSNLTLRHAGPLIPGDLGVASAGITLSVSLFHPSTLRLSLAGPLHVRAGDAPDVIVTADETSVSVPLDQTGPMLIGLRASGLRLEPATGAWHVTVGLLTTQAKLSAETEAGSEPSDPAATFAVTSEAIALPAGTKWPLGTNISSLSFDGALNGPLPKDHDITRWAEAWRDGGGSLEIRHLAMGWGPLGLTSSATLALDDQLQPMGSGNGRIVGYAEVLDRLAGAGMLTKSAATAAKAVLSLMAGAGDGNGPSAVDVPLTLQYRTLSMRQVPLVRLPELDWPAR
ncbi:MAG: DUF2125 domain-containing protein [Rhodopila sp.]|nr:DUF2125 domain-containing protein [Rhodopila sp.]